MEKQKEGWTNLKQGMIIIFKLPSVHRSSAHPPTSPKPKPLAHIRVGLLFFPLAPPLTCLCGKSSHVTTSYLPHNQDFSNCKEDSLLSMHKNTQCAIIFWKWGLREVFSMKSNLHFSATNASFLLGRIICTTDLYLKIEGRIYAKMISGDHRRNTKK